jgi:hypothetical protein
MSLHGLTEMEEDVIVRMHKRRVYGTHHKQIQTIMKSGFPPHMYKEVKQAIVSLIKKGFIVWYHRADKSIQLNKEKATKIGEIVKGK